ncbi:MAG TPA: DUF748 domain-containing protein [Polyangiales bacterium]
MRARNKILVGVALLGFMLLIARLIAPIYILGYVNKTLRGLDGYTGRVADIELSLWRGAYVIEGVTIDKTTEKLPVPFVSVERVDISVHWDALLKGAIVAELELTAPQLNIVAERKKETAQEQQVEDREQQRAASGQETSWQTQVKQLVPLDINRIGIRRGQVRFRDPYAEPKVDIPMGDLHGEIANLTNSEELSKDMVARASFRGTALHSGKLAFDGNIDPYAKKPSFDVQAQLEDLQLRELNDFLKAYANVDAEKGTFSVYSEVTAKNGRFKGYVKPLLRNVELLRWREEKENFFGKLWEGMVELGKDVLENREQKQVATRVPLSGRIDDPNADIYATVIEVLRNAFIEALRRGLEPELGDQGFARRENK